MDGQDVATLLAPDRKMRLEVARCLCEVTVATAMALYPLKT